MSLEIFPANIRLEDILKTSFIFVFRRRLQDVFKTFWSRRMYSSYLYVFSRCFQGNFKSSWSRPINWSWLYVLKSLQDVLKMYSSRLEDVLQKRLQHILKTSSRYFKTSSRHLQDMLLRRLQEIFKMFWRRLAKSFTRHLQDIFKTFWIRLQLQDVFSVFARVIKDSQVLVFHLIIGLVVAYIGVFRAWSNIYNGAFFAKILNGLTLFTIFAKKLHHRCLTDLKIGYWLTV